jgi:hypothetical protein
MKPIRNMRIGLVLSKMLTFNGNRQTRIGNLSSLFFKQSFDMSWEKIKQLPIADSHLQIAH